MALIHNLGFPRIGATRELKFALESYWKGQLSRDELKAVGAQLRKIHWEHQSGLNLVPVGDFSFYDQVLDISFTLGNLPERVQGFTAMCWIIISASPVVVPRKAKSTHTAVVVLLPVK